MNAPFAVSAPSPKIEGKPDLKEAFEKGWQVIVWNDSVNLMSYVVHVFQRVLGFNQTKARKHMLEVHDNGKSCVVIETREKAEFYWQRIQQQGLRVTLEKAT